MKTVLPFLLLLAGCEGPVGPVGPAGNADHFVLTVDTQPGAYGGGYCAKCWSVTDPRITINTRFQVYVIIEGGYRQVAGQLIDYMLDEYNGDIRSLQAITENTLYLQDPQRKLQDLTVIAYFDP